MVSSIQLKGVDNLATNKNITMKQFNGTDYDTLYPKTIASQIPDVYSKTDTITAETLSQLGLTADKLPNDAFQQIKTLVDNAQSSADSKARVQTGSYVGTGTYGKDNPCSVTFDFIPRFFMILGCSSSDIPYHEEGSGYAMACFDKIGRTYPNVSYNSTDSNGFGYHGQTGTRPTRQYYASRAKLVDRTFSWFTQRYDEEDRVYLSAADKQYNLSSYTYYWIAIG